MRIPKTLAGEAAEYWRRNAPILIKAGLLTDADRDSFIVLCLTWERLCKATDAGTIEWVCLSKQYQNFAKSFGLTPAARKSLKVELDQPVSDEFGF